MARVRIPPKQQLGSVDNALRLLLLFRDHPLVRVSDAAEALGLGRSTVHRTLATLQYRGFVQQDEESRSYRLGPALLQVRLASLLNSEIRQLARPHLEDLCRRLGETTHLLVLENATTVFIESVESDRPLRTTSRVGQVLPAHATSGGKALLAQLPLAELRRIYPRERLTASTPRTITSRAALEQELEQVRRRGYATNFGEAEPEITAVGVAISVDGRDAPAAIAVSGPASRLTESVVSRIAEAAIDTAGAIGTELI